MSADSDDTYDPGSGRPRRLPLNEGYQYYPRFFPSWSWGRAAGSDNMAYSGEGMYYGMSDDGKRMEQGMYQGNLYDNAPYLGYKSSRGGGSYKLKPPSSYTDEEAYQKADRRRCCVVLAIVGLVFLIGAGIAIGVYFGVVDKPESKIDQEQPETVLAVAATLTIDEPYDPALDDPTSNVYIAKKAQAEKEIDDSMRNSIQASSYIGNTVTGFSDGSTKVHDRIQFRSNEYAAGNQMRTITPASVADVLKTELRRQEQTVFNVDATVVEAAAVQAGQVDLGQACTDVTDCIDSDTVCDTARLCACQPTHFDSTPNNVGGVCVKKKAINATCQGQGQCETSGAECAGSQGSKVCSCPSTRYYDSTSNSCMTKIAFNTSGCVDAALQCQTTNAECQNDRCLCASDTFLKNDACVTKIALNAQGCTQDTDCITPGAVCAGDTCLCSALKFYSQTQDQCLDKIPQGGSCTEALECIVTDAKCTQDICACAADEYVNEDACVAKLPNGGNCQSDEACLYSGAQCISGICNCSPIMYLDGTTCVDKLEYNASCAADGECNTTNAVCNQAGVCACLDGFYYNEVDSCLPLVDNGDACTDTIQCSVINAVCNSQSVCACVSSQYKSGTTCVDKKNNGETCDFTTECKVTNAECLSSVCNCRSALYEDTTTQSCVPKVGDGEDCSDDVQCLLTGATCTGDKCTCPDTTYVTSTACAPKVLNGGDCVQANQCLFIGAECNAGTCGCAADTYEDNNQCLSKLGLGEICTKDEACSFTNSVCDSVCKCAPNTYAEGTACLNKKPNGETCTQTIQCNVTDAECAGTCKCGAAKYENNGMCVDKLAFGDQCSNIEGECATQGASCINSNCACLDTHFLDGNKCSEKIDHGAACNAMDDCKYTNAICSSQQCTCDADRFANTETESCELKLPNGGSCSADFQCSVERAICNANECACPRTTYLQGTACVDRKANGQACQQAGQCLAENAVCEVSVCSCSKTDYLDGTTCRPKKPNGQQCTDSVQCSVGGAECDGTCNCPGSTYSNGTSCLPKKQNGATCQTADQCSVTGAQCDVVCDCPDNQYLDGTACVDKAPLNGDCKQDSHCVTPGAKCLSDQCNCQSSFYFDGTECVAKKAFNETCSIDEMCLPTDSICGSQTSLCECEEGNYLEGFSCLPKKDFGQNCPFDEACLASEGVCNTVCECPDGLYEKATECAPKIPNGELCETDFMCLINGAKCSSDICGCVDDTYEEGDSCVPKKPFGGVCTMAGQCVTPNSDCINGQCSCNDQQYLDDVTGCQQKLADGATCNFTAQCETNNAECNLGTSTCQCPSNMYLADTECLEKTGDGQDCNLATDCLYQGADCISSFCTCAGDTFANTTSETCDDKIANGLPCDSSLVCIVQNAECSGVCQCPEDMYEDGNSCLLKKLNDQPCASVVECKVTDAECSSTSGTCVCQQGTYLEGEACLAKKPHGGSCDMGFECETTGADCYDSLCACSQTHYFDGTSSCAPKKPNGDSCQEDEQCMVGGALCNDQAFTCQCLDTQYLLGSSCVDKNPNGGFCSEDMNCLFSSSICSSAQCACPANMYENAAQKACLPKQGNGAACSSADACLLDGAICNETCKCADNAYANGAVCSLRKDNGEVCIVTEECGFPGAICDQTCGCPSDKYAGATQCLDKKPNNEGCDDDFMCQFSGARCIDGTCLCPAGTYTSGTSCINKLNNGNACESVGQCLFGGAVCNQICMCSSTTYEDNQQCVPKVPYEGSCTASGQCHTPDAICDLDNTSTCLCDSNYFLDGDKCSLKINNGETCAQDDECNYSDAICHSSFCTCPDDRYADDVEQACLSKKDNGLSCQVDAECGYPQAQCIGGICNCPVNMFLNETFCQDKLAMGVKCDAANQCVVHNAVCNNECTCADGQYFNGSLCVNKKENGQSCTMDDECGYPGAGCYGSKCNCSADKFSDGIRCVSKKLNGVTCSAVSECGVTFAICNGTCRCTSDMYLDGSTCRPKVANGGSCVDSTNCIVLEATCTNFICDCSDNDFYDEANTRCKRKSPIGGQCTQGSDCITDNAECSNEICQCGTNMYLGDTACLSRKPNGVFCEVSDECSMVGAICDAECRCPDNNYENGDMCSEKVPNGGNCSFSSACQVDRAVCLAGHCTCPTTMYLAGSECLDKKAAGDSCMNSYECSLGGGACLQDVCSCHDSQYLDSENNCQTKIAYNGSCTATDQCDTGKAICHETTLICVCPENMYRGDDNICYNQLGETCNSAADCSFANADCIFGFCTCPDDTYSNLSSSSCNPKVPEGGLCSDPSMCLNSGSLCSTVCTCPTGTYIEGTACLPKRQHGQSCNSTSQCDALEAVCLENVCNCSAENYYFNNICRPKVEFNQQCLSGDACLDPFVCTDSFCACDEGFVLEENTCVEVVPPVTTTTEPPPDEEAVVNVDGELVSDTPYDPALDDPTSELYNTTASQVAEALTNNLVTNGSAVNDVQILGFQQGSTRGQYRMEVIVAAALKGSTPTSSSGAIDTKDNVLTAISKVVEVAVVSVAVELKNTAAFSQVNEEVSLSVVTDICTDVKIQIEYTQRRFCKRIRTKLEKSSRDDTKASTARDLLDCIVWTYKLEKRVCSWNTVRTWFEDIVLGSIFGSDEIPQLPIQGVYNFEDDEPEYSGSSCLLTRYLLVIARTECSDHMKKAVRLKGSKACSAVKDLSECIYEALVEQEDCSSDEFSSDIILTRIVTYQMNFFEDKSFSLEKCEFCLLPNLEWQFGRNCGRALPVLASFSDDSIWISILQDEVNCLDSVVTYSWSSETCTRDKLIPLFKSSQNFFYGVSELIPDITPSILNTYLDMEIPRLGPVNPESVCTDQNALKYIVLYTACRIDFTSHDNYKIQGAFTTVQCVQEYLLYLSPETTCEFDVLMKAIFAPSSDLVGVLNFVAGNEYDYTTIYEYYNQSIRTLGGRCYVNFYRNYNNIYNACAQTKVDGDIMRYVLSSATLNCGYLHEKTRCMARAVNRFMPSNEMCPPDIIYLHAARILFIHAYVSLEGLIVDFSSCTNMTAQSSDETALCGEPVSAMVTAVMGCGRILVDGVDADKIPEEGTSECSSFDSFAECAVRKIQPICPRVNVEELLPQAASSLEVFQVPAICYDGDDDGSEDEDDACFNVGAIFEIAGTKCGMLARELIAAGEEMGRSDMCQKFGELETCVIETIQFNKINCNEDSVHTTLLNDWHTVQQMANGELQQKEDLTLAEDYFHPSECYESPCQSASFNRFADGDCSDSWDKFEDNSTNCQHFGYFLSCVKFHAALSNATCDVQNLHSMLLDWTVHRGINVTHCTYATISNITKNLPNNSNEICGHGGPNNQTVKYLYKYVCMKASPAMMSNFTEEEKCLSQFASRGCVFMKMEQFGCIRQSIDEVLFNTKLANRTCDTAVPLSDCKRHYVDVANEVGEKCYISVAMLPLLAINGTNLDTEPSLKDKTKLLKCSLYEDAYACAKTLYPYEGNCEMAEIKEILNKLINATSKAVIQSLSGNFTELQRSRVKPLDLSVCQVQDGTTYQTCPSNASLVEKSLANCGFYLITHGGALSSCARGIYIFGPCVMEAVKTYMKEASCFKDQDPMMVADTAITEYSMNVNQILGFDQRACKAALTCATNFSRDDNCISGFYTAIHYANQISESDQCLLFPLLIGDMETCLIKRFPSCQEHSQNALSQMISWHSPQVPVLNDLETCSAPANKCESLGILMMIRCLRHINYMDNCMVRECAKQMPIPENWMCGEFDRQMALDYATSRLDNFTISCPAESTFIVSLKFNVIAWIDEYGDQNSSEYQSLIEDLIPIMRILFVNQNVQIFEVSQGSVIVQVYVMAYSVNWETILERINSSGQNIELLMIKKEDDGDIDSACYSMEDIYHRVNKTCSNIFSELVNTEMSRVKRCQMLSNFSTCVLGALRENKTNCDQNMIEERITNELYTYYKNFKRSKGEDPDYDDHFMYLNPHECKYDKCLNSRGLLEIARNSCANAFTTARDHSIMDKNLCMKMLALSDCVEREINRTTHGMNICRTNETLMALAHEMQPPVMTVKLDINSCYDYKCLPLSFGRLASGNCSDSWNKFAENSSNCQHFGYFLSCVKFHAALSNETCEVGNLYSMLQNWTIHKDINATHCSYANITGITKNLPNTSNEICGQGGPNNQTVKYLYQYVCMKASPAMMSNFTEEEKCLSEFASRGCVFAHMKPFGCIRQSIDEVLFSTKLANRTCDTAVPLSDCKRHYVDVANEMGEKCYISVAMLPLLAINGTNLDTENSLKNKTKLLKCSLYEDAYACAKTMYPYEGNCEMAEIKEILNKLINATSKAVIQSLSGNLTELQRSRVKPLDFSVCQVQDGTTYQMCPSNASLVEKSLANCGFSLTMYGGNLSSCARGMYIFGPCVMEAVKTYMKEASCFNDQNPMMVADIALSEYSTDVYRITGFNHSACKAAMNCATNFSMEHDCVSGFYTALHYGNRISESYQCVLNPLVIGDMKTCLNKRIPSCQEHSQNALNQMISWYPGLNDLENCSAPANKCESLGILMMVRCLRHRNYMDNCMVRECAKQMPIPENWTCGEFDRQTALDDATSRLENFIISCPAESTFIVSLKFNDIDWIVEYGDQNSSEYQSLIEDLIPIMRTLFVNQSSHISGVRQGSVIVQVYVTAFSVNWETILERINSSGLNIELLMIEKEDDGAFDPVCYSMENIYHRVNKTCNNIFSELVNTEMSRFKGCQLLSNFSSCVIGALRKNKTNCDQNMMQEMIRKDLYTYYSNFKMSRGEDPDYNDHFMYLNPHECKDNMCLNGKTMIEIAMNSNCHTIYETVKNHNVMDKNLCTKMWTLSDCVEREINRLSFGMNTGMNTSMITGMITVMSTGMNTGMSTGMNTCRTNETLMALAHEMQPPFMAIKFDINSCNAYTCSPLSFGRLASGNCSDSWEKFAENSSNCHHFGSFLSCVKFHAARSNETCDIQNLHSMLQNWTISKGLNATNCTYKTISDITKNLPNTSNEICGHGGPNNQTVKYLYKYVCMKASPAMMSNFTEEEKCLSQFASRGCVFKHMKEFGCTRQNVDEALFNSKLANRTCDTAVPLSDCKRHYVDVANEIGEKCYISVAMLPLLAINGTNLDTEPSLKNKTMLLKCSLYENAYACAKTLYPYKGTENCEMTEIKEILDKLINATSKAIINSMIGNVTELQRTRIKPLDFSQCQVKDGINYTTCPSNASLVEKSLANCGFAMTVHGGNMSSCVRGIYIFGPCVTETVKAYMKEASCFKNQDPVAVADNAIMKYSADVHRILGFNQSSCKATIRCASNFSMVWECTSGFYTAVYSSSSMPRDMNIYQCVIFPVVINDMKACLNERVQSCQEHSHEAVNEMISWHRPQMPAVVDNCSPSDEQKCGSLGLLLYMNCSRHSGCGMRQCAKEWVFPASWNCADARDKQTLLDETTSELGHGMPDCGGESDYRITLLLPNEEWTTGYSEINSSESQALIERYLPGIQRIFGGDASVAELRESSVIMVISLRAYTIDELEIRRKIELYGLDFELLSIRKDGDENEADVCRSITEINKRVSPYCNIYFSKLFNQELSEMEKCSKYEEFLNCVSESLEDDHIYCNIRDVFEYGYYEYIELFQQSEGDDFNKGEPLNPFICREFLCTPSSFDRVSANECSDSWEKVEKSPNVCRHFEQFIGCIKTNALYRTEFCPLNTLYNNLKHWAAKKDMHVNICPDYCEENLEFSLSDEQNIAVHWNISKMNQKIMFTIAVPLNFDIRVITLGLLNNIDQVEFHNISVDLDMRTVSISRSSETETGPYFETGTHELEIETTMEGIIIYFVEDIEDSFRRDFYLQLNYESNSGNESGSFISDETYTFECEEDLVAFNATLPATVAQICTSVPVHQYVWEYKCYTPSPPNVLSDRQKCLFLASARECVVQTLAGFDCDESHLNASFQRVMLPGPNLNLYCDKLLGLTECENHYIMYSDSSFDKCMMPSLTLSLLTIDGTNVETLISPLDESKPLKCGILEDSVACFMHEHPHDMCSSASYANIIKDVLDGASYALKAEALASLSPNIQDSYTGTNFSTCPLTDVMDYIQCPSHGRVVQNIIAVCSYVKIIKLTSDLTNPCLLGKYVFMPCAMAAMSEQMRKCDIDTEQFVGEAINMYPDIIQAAVGIDLNVCKYTSIKMRFINEIWIDSYSDLDSAESRQFIDTRFGAFIQSLGSDGQVVPTGLYEGSVVFVFEIMMFNGSDPATVIREALQNRPEFADAELLSPDDQEATCDYLQGWGPLPINTMSSPDELCSALGNTVENVTEITNRSDILMIYRCVIEELVPEDLKDDMVKCLPGSTDETRPTSVPPPGTDGSMPVSSGAQTMPPPRASSTKPPPK